MFEENDPKLIEGANNGGTREEKSNEDRAAGGRHNETDEVEVITQPAPPVRFTHKFGMHTPKKRELVCFSTPI